MARFSSHWCPSLPLPFELYCEDNPRKLIDPQAEVFPPLDAAQVQRIQAVQRCFLFQHLFSDSGLDTLRAIHACGWLSDVLLILDNAHRIQSESLRAITVALSGARILLLGHQSDALAEFQALLSFGMRASK